VIDLDTAMICSSALRKGLAQVGAWTINGKPQPLPPPLTPAMQQVVDRMVAKKRSAGNTPALDGGEGSVSSSLPGTPNPQVPPLQVIPSMKNLSFSDWDNSDGESSVNQSLRGVAPMVYEWASRAHEDGYPVPTLVEELVEKNGLAAAL
jgi:hypothetical protein